MKKGTSIFLILFFLSAVSLYVIIYVLPKFTGAPIETLVLESEALPIADSERVLVVRSETLYDSPYSGKTSYKYDDGARVRKGATIMSVGSSTIEAETTGTVSFSSDGYEAKLTPESIPTLRADDVKNISDNASSLKKKDVQAGEPVFKLTDTALWYLVFWIDADSVSLARYNENKTVKVDFGDGEVVAKVDSVADSDGDFRVTLACDRYYENMEDVRLIDANIIFAENTGLVLDRECVAPRNGQNGVFVKQRSGTFKWVPVKIDENASTDEKYIVAAGTYTDDGGDAVRTVNYYDEVLKDPKSAGYE